VQLTWFDRHGKTLGNLGDGPYNGMSLSPDGKSVAVTYAPARGTNLWIFDLVRGVKTRATFGSDYDANSQWSPDGRKLVYTSVAGAHFKLRLKDLTNGIVEELYDAAGIGATGVTSWSADGQKILFTTASPSMRADIFWMSLADRKSHPYLSTEFIEANGRFSPDGKWVAYQSNESGTNEIYVAPFPPTGAKWQVSNGGGVVPRWRRDGKEMFYVAPAIRSIVSVPITLGATPQIGQATKLFDFHPGLLGPTMYDVTTDGQRFLINTRIGEEPPPQPLILVQHFDRELRAALAGGR